MTPVFSKTKMEIREELKARQAMTLKAREEAEAARSKLEEAEAIRKAEQASVTPDKSIQATNEYIATSWDMINRSVDTFFTNKESPTVNKSSLFLSLSAGKSESSKLENKIDFQAKFDFPNTTKNLKIVIEKQQDEIGNVLSDKSVTSTATIVKNGKQVSRTESSYTAGANLLLRQTKSFTSLIKFGIRIEMPLNPSLKLDLQKEIPTKAFNISLLQKFLFYRQEGFQEISQISLSRKLNETFTLSQTNSLVWADENDDFLMRNGIVLSQSLAPEKALTYSIGANARLSPAFYYESYDTSVSYTQKLYQDWLYTSFTVGANFPKEKDFTDVKFVQLRLDIFFKEK